MNCENCWFKDKRGLKHNPCNKTTYGCLNYVAKHHGINLDYLYPDYSKMLLVDKDTREDLIVIVFDMDGNKLSTFSMKYNSDDDQNFYLISNEGSFTIKKEDLKFTHDNKAIYFEKNAA